MFKQCDECGVLSDEKVDWGIVVLRGLRFGLMSSALPTSLSTSDRVNKVLCLIRPAVQADGGDVELVRITPEGVAEIRLHGACVGCPSSSMTLQVGIERNLKQHVPEVKSVKAVV